MNSEEFGLANMKIDVKLDRITIVGSVNIDKDKLNDNLRKIGWVDSGTDLAGFSKFELLRPRKNKRPENKAVFLHNDYQTTWRIDTSNHLSEEEKDKVVKALSFLNGKHISRIDIAFDFINGPYNGMKHRLYPKGTTTSYVGENLFMLGKGEKIETIYAGKRKSLSQYRYYDKLIERQRAGVKVDKSIKSWERLELQVRGKKTKEWLLNSKTMLSCFKLPELEKATKLDENGQRVPLSFQEYAAFRTLLEDPNAWRLIGSKSTKSKYKKIMDENDGFALNNDYADLAFDALKLKKEDLNNEVNSFLTELKNAENKIDGSGAL